MGLIIGCGWSHDYGQWKVIKKGISKNVLAKKFDTIFLVQTRKCERCGFVEQSLQSNDVMEGVLK